MEVDILVVTINQDAEVVADPITTATGNEIVSLSENRTVVHLLCCFSGQKRNYSDNNSRGGGGKNTFLLSCMSVVELQKLTIRTG